MRLKKFLAILLTAVLLVSSTVIALPVSADGGDIAPAWEYKDGTLTGSGKENDPYIIATAQDLATLAYKVNNNLNNDGTARDGDNFSMHQYFEQTADIDLDNIPWQVIGRNDGKLRFCGSYDGGGYAIKNLKIENITGLSSYGLFGYTAYRNVSAATEIKNVNIVSGDISVSSASSVGALVGYAYNGLTLTNCSNMASVTVTNVTGGDLGFGGLVGTLRAGNALTVTVENCYNGADVTVTATSTSNANMNVAGMFGEVRAYSGASISNCVNFGNVTLTNQNFANESRVGGIVGYWNSMEGASWNWNSAGVNVAMTNVSNVADVTLNEYGNTPHNNTRMGSLVAYLRVGKDDAKGTLTVNGCFASGKLISTTAQKVGAVARAFGSNVSEGDSKNYFSYEVTPTASATANYVFTEGTKALDLSALSLLSVRGAQYKTDAELGLCVRFVGELNLESFAGIKDVGVCVIWGDKTANVSGEHKLYSSLTQMAPDGVITPNGAGYLLAAGVSGVPQNAEITLSFKPYVEFEDGTIAYGAESAEITFDNGAYVAPQA